MPNNKSEFDQIFGNFVFGWSGSKEHLEKLLTPYGSKTDTKSYPDTRTAKIASEIENLLQRLDDIDYEVNDLVRDAAIKISKI